MDDDSLEADLAKWLARHSFVSDHVGDWVRVEVVDLRAPETPIGTCQNCGTPLTHRGDAGWRHDLGWSFTRCSQPVPAPLPWEEQSS